MTLLELGLRLAAGELAGDELGGDELEAGELDGAELDGEGATDGAVLTEEGLGRGAGLELLAGAELDVGGSATAVPATDPE